MSDLGPASVELGVEQRGKFAEAIRAQGREAEGCREREAGGRREREAEGRREREAGGRRGLVVLRCMAAGTGRAGNRFGRRELAWPLKSRFLNWLLRPGR